MIKVDYHLDTKCLSCPMPIVKTKKSMYDLGEGEVIEIQATDKGSKADLAAWAESVGHEYLGSTEKADVLYHYIRKKTRREDQDAIFSETVQNEKLLEAKGLILDVREPVEYAFGHIPGAKSMPLGELEKGMIELDREASIYVICRTGSRSALAAEKLKNNGFKKIYNVLPGMTKWSGQLITTIQEEN